MTLVEPVLLPERGEALCEDVELGKARLRVGDVVLVLQMRYVLGFRPSVSLGKGAFARRTEAVGQSAGVDGMHRCELLEFANLPKLGLNCQMRAGVASDHNSKTEANSRRRRDTWRRTLLVDIQHLFIGPRDHFTQAHHSKRMVDRHQPQI